MSSVSITAPTAAFSTSLPTIQSALQRTRSRCVLIASSDSSQRQRLGNSLRGLRWQVLEAQGGADAWVASQSCGQLEAMLIDPWLPDLDITEFLTDFHREYPGVTLMLSDGSLVQNSSRSPYHQELLYALRQSQEVNTAAWNVAPALEEKRELTTLAGFCATSPTPTAVPSNPDSHAGKGASSETGTVRTRDLEAEEPTQTTCSSAAELKGGALHPVSSRGYASKPAGAIVAGRITVGLEPIPELIGSCRVMLEVSRRIRLVAGRATPVLIEGPTGSGKELVAEALHRLSSRSRKPFVAINCAAIPEALLEAELFGHTRGAFTGAVQGRTGRIESADGGTLFLDEIGEMPLALQAKLLRFVESGELQRIGDNETVKVDVRIVAATHQPLAQHAIHGDFRPDLYYRLAVFLIRTPALKEHMEDLPQLVHHFMGRMGRTSPVKQVDVSAMAKLETHEWPGNVRELEHVLERAAILVGDDPVITELEIDFGLSPAN